MIAGSVRFLNVRYDRLDIDQAAAAIRSRAESGGPFSYVVTPNAQIVVMKNKATYPRANAAWDAAWLSTNDSGPVERLTRLLFGVDLGRVTGSDLTLRLFQDGIDPSQPMTIIGGGDEMEARLRSRFGFTALARYNPPMGLLHNPAEIEACARFIVDNPAPYIFLAVGTPQGEIVALRALEMGAPAGVGLCLGASLNFVTGIEVRAPRLVSRLGTEWLYRLARNPRGHARRVFVQSLPVLFLCLRARLRGEAPMGVTSPADARP